MYKSNFSFESVFRAAMSGGSKPSGSGRGRGSKSMAGPGHNGAAPAAAAPAGRGGAVVRNPVPAAPAADALLQPAAPAVAPPESPIRGTGNEVEDANENVIVSPEEITASRRDGTNAKRKLSGDECIEGFDKNAPSMRWVFAFCDLGTRMF